MKKILIVTGELSGEIHASNLLKYINEKKSSVECYAVGSDILKSCGCKIIADYRNISIIGFVEVIKKYIPALKIFNRVKRFLYTNRPDLVILVDFPGFNLRLAKVSHKLGIKTVYFIPPQIWAWHYNRIKKIKKYIDFVIPILPFEEKIFKDAEVAAKYFAHPLVENISGYISKKEFKKRLKIKDRYKVISLFPGSRQQEIEYNLDLMLKSAKEIAKQMQNIFYIVGCAPTIDKSIINEKIREYSLKNIKVVQGDTYSILNISDAAIVVSGTITLEAAYFKVPMVVIYHLSKLSYWFIKNFIIKIKFISLVNIIRNREVVKELVGNRLSVDNIKSEVVKILQNKRYNNKMKKELNKIKAVMGKKGVLKRAVDEILFSGDGGSLGSLYSIRKADLQ